MTRANAIAFTGGTNILELAGDGSAYATITGEMVAVSGGTDTLKLSGAGGVFDAADIDAGNGGQFKNFAAIEVASACTWVVKNFSSVNWGTFVTAPALAVQSGTLQLGNSSVNGGLMVSATVANGATLSNDPTGTHTGYIFGDITVEAGGHPAATVVANRSAISSGAGAIILHSGAVLDATLGASDSGNAVYYASTNLTLNITDNGAMGLGTYLVIQYDGTLAGSGLTIGTAPTDFEYTINTSIAGEVQLLVADGGLYWSGTTTGGSTSSVDGGTGTWSANGSTNWTNSGGTSHVAWSDGKNAVFAGAAGTVWVDTTRARSSPRASSSSPRVMRSRLIPRAMFSRWPVLRCSRW
ncbi:MULTISPECIES: hypothetical protein [unclassified Xanthobacter]|uniref:hypothetical protein n=1 Tax=unclassified Xanthobacter TaxID=2623496 RepID=UPI001F359175|nr:MULTISPECIES: hypothetical protein [unclassified Xanthobacter]